MKLYIMRHGQAQPHGQVQDHERALTERGVERVKNAGVVLRRTGIQPAHILCSPRVRARQTAEIIGEALEIEPTVDDAMNFDFNVVAARDFVTTYGKDGDLILVGHEPTLSETIAHVTGAQVDMKPGSFVRIDLTSPRQMRGTLVWVVAPKVFDAIADDTNEG